MDANPRQDAGLGLFTLTSLVVASMIGAGVFTTSGFALADLGTPGRVLTAWLVGGGVAICGALSYGALAQRMTASGGEYLFLSRSIHPLAGFLAGWVSLLAGFTGAIAFAATAFESYLLPAHSRPAWLPADTLAVSVVLVCGAAHGLQKRSGIFSHNLTVIVKLVLIVALLGYALVLVPTDVWRGTVSAGETAPAFSLSAFALTLMWISLSYSGFNAAVYVAGEAQQPAVSVPRAMLVGTLLVMVLYVALNAVFVYAPAPETIIGQEDVAARAASALGGAWLAVGVRGLIALALLSSVSAMVLAGPRVYAQMAQDGVLPAMFQMGKELPRAAITLQVGLACLVILVSGLRELLSYLGFTLSLSAAATVASLFVIRRREIRSGGAPMAIIGYPFVPGIFVICTLGFACLAAFRQPWEPLAGIATLAIGLLVYVLFGRTS